MSLCFALCQQNTRDCMRTYDEFACLQPANQRHAMPRQQTTECIDDAFICICCETAVSRYLLKVMPGLGARMAAKNMCQSS